jgi:hypothetical protein
MYQRHRLTALLLAVILAATVVPRLPFLANAAHSLDSDEAANALALHHMLDGDGFRFHGWGVTHFGIQESVLAIPFVLLLGHDPLAFKLAAVTGFLFLVLSTFVLGATLYGRAAGLAAAALLITFSPHVVQWSTLAVVGFGLVMGWGSLLLAFLARLERRPTRLGFAWLGFMAGFGFYMYELFIDYLATLALAAITASFLWQALLARDAEGRRRALSAAGGQIRMASAFGVGFAIGWAPRIAVLLRGGSTEIHPDYQLGDLEAVRANVVLLVRDCVPAFLGVNPAGSRKLEQFTGPATLWTAVLDATVLIAWAAVWACGFARVRRTLGGAVARPSRCLDVESVVVLLVPVSLLLFLLSTNPEDINSDRYLFPWLSSLPILGGALIVRLARWRLAPAAALLALLVGFPAVATARSQRVLGYLEADLSLRRPNEPLLEVLAYLRRKEIRGAYGGYWTAFKATYLSRESIIVAPYRDWERYPPYNEIVDGLATEAYIFFDPLDAERHAAFLAEVNARGGPFEMRRFGPYVVYSSARPGRRLLPP